MPINIDRLGQKNTDGGQFDNSQYSTKVATGQNKQLVNRKDDLAKQLTNAKLV